MRIYMRRCLRASSQYLSASSPVMTRSKAAAASAVASSAPPTVFNVYDNDEDLAMAGLHNNHNNIVRGSVSAGNVLLDNVERGGAAAMDTTTDDDDAPAAEASSFLAGGRRRDCDECSPPAAKRLRSSDSASVMSRGSAAAVPPVGNRSNSRAASASSSAAAGRRGCWIYDSTPAGVVARIDDRFMWWALLFFLAIMVLSNVVVNNGRLETERSLAEVGAKSLREYAELTNELAKMGKSLGNFKRVMEGSRSHEILSRALFDDLPPCGCDQRCVPLDWAASVGARGDEPKLRDRARRRYFPESSLPPPPSTPSPTPSTSTTTTDRGTPLLEAVADDDNYATNSTTNSNSTAGVEPLPAAG